MIKNRYEFSEEKNIILKETRGVNFDDILEAIKKGDILDDIAHHSKNKHQTQRIFVVKIKNYIYAVPYVIDKKNNWIFLKTVYPSRILTKSYLKK